MESTTEHALVRSEKELRIATEMNSRARIDLADGRTFLVWLRAGVNLIAVGLAADFLPEETRSYDPVATAMVTIAESVALFGLPQMPLVLSLR